MSDIKHYGLFLFTYDHYEWEELIAVSSDFDKLKNRYENYTGLYDDKDLVSEDDRDELIKKEQAHFSIMEVEYI